MTNIQRDYSQTITTTGQYDNTTVEFKIKMSRHTHIAHPQPNTSGGQKKYKKHHVTINEK